MKTLPETANILMFPWNDTEIGPFEICIDGHIVTIPPQIAEICREYSSFGEATLQKRTVGFLSFPFIGLHPRHIAWVKQIVILLTKKFDVVILFGSRELLSLLQKETARSYLHLQDVEDRQYYFNLQHCPCCDKEILSVRNVLTNDLLCLN